ncbi:MAG: HU family DNA-binding protein [Rhodothermaceae bacterium]|nr:HU family DNA-binding protein [Rhodothermaceae bacterium]
MISSELLKEALADVIQDALAQGEEVVLPDFGMLRLEKKPSEISKDESGRIIMRPPRDHVVFYPGDF